MPNLSFEVMEVLPHHVKQDVCRTRPKYREGKVPKTVKVYACAQESKYVIATNIPSVGAHNELLKYFTIYGPVEEHKMLDEYPCEAHCETMLIKFSKIQHARVAKIKMDNYNFYGGSLHVFYAPEFESVSDVREKIDERKAVIAAKCAKYDAMKFGTVEYDLMEKKEPYKRVGFGKNKSRDKKNERKETNKEADKCIYPQPPSNWVKPSQTGSHSLDQTVNEINKQLETTQPHQQEVNLLPRKRRKILQS